ncbi:hypothetical protein L8956_04140 [Peribacillus frigoritolerans]|uniref:hypothetical protein n=1 Tax=Peribacillus frigoritolerans TaxID=450367 RepID=UPI001EFE79F2|nr:hypothetical protein [Peribacillus frigoritolerans]ULM97928.1 hypothetical protein L8956_04140 [Peribacillus frigoritolerans]
MDNAKIDSAIDNVKIDSAIDNVKTDPATNKEKIDSTITIAILTAFSYGVAYIYQLSYKSYYKLPTMSIELNINTMTPILVGAFFLSIVIYIIWNQMKFYYSVNPPKFQGIYYIHLGIGLSFIKEYWKPFNLTIYTIIMFLICLGALIIGEFMASIKKEYMVIHQKENLYVEVSSFKDLIIIAPLNIETNSITPKFKTIEMKELKDIEIVRFESGLKVEDMKKIPDPKLSKEPAPAPAFKFEDLKKKYKKDGLKGSFFKE